MRLITSVIISVLFFQAIASAQDDVYQKPSEFISETFGGNVPKAGAVTLTKSRQSDVKKLIGRSYSSGRVRYWSDGKKAAWILEEIGKTRPITIGCVTSAGKIVSISVLIYRESHGWEVKQPFFTNQFRDAALKGDGKLTARIDNIAGATLSTRAMTKMAKLALYLDKQR